MVCSVPKMGWLAAWASHRSLHTAGSLLLSLNLVQPSETQKEIARELLFVSRLMDSSDYTMFILILATGKFRFPGITELSVPPVLHSCNRNTLFSQVLFVDSCLTSPFPPSEAEIQQKGRSCCEGGARGCCFVEVFWSSRACL